jgi:hypothetical protein
MTGTAILFEVFFAIITIAAAINQATHRGMITYLEFFYMGAYANHSANDFMSGYTGVNGPMPFISGRM